MRVATSPLGGWPGADGALRAHPGEGSKCSGGSLAVSRALCCFGGWSSVSPAGLPCWLKCCGVDIRSRSANRRTVRWNSLRFPVLTLRSGISTIQPVPRPQIWRIVPRRDRDGDADRSAQDPRFIDPSNYSLFT